MIKCRICGKDTKFIFKKKVLSKYEVSYFKCSFCKSVMTEDPYWLDEAYGNAIATTDVGLVSRNLSLATLTEFLLKFLFDNKKKYLDYGGGYGMFVRLMRDKGYDFYRYDVYCENLFAKYFDFYDLKDKEKKFGLVTAFELMEHIVDPAKEVQKMLVYSDSLLFSTTICPNDETVLKDWWYLSTETGQHVTLYSREGIEKLADRFSLNYYTDGVSYHFLTRKKFLINPFIFLKLIRLVRNGTRIDYVLRDYEFIKRKIS